MEDKTSNTGSGNQVNSSSGSLEVADDKRTVSSYGSVSSSYPLESLEVHDPNAPNVTPIEDDFINAHSRSLTFSKRKAIIVSTVITLIVTLLTGILVLGLSGQNKDDITPSNALASQDLELKGNKDTIKPSEITSRLPSILVEGDIITRSTLKISNNGFVTVIQPQTLTDNRILTLPDASGTVCLDSNNCNFATSAQLQQVINQLAQITVPAAAAQTVVNGQTGAISIQGTSNQISVTTSAGLIKLATPQDLAPISSPTFAGLVLNGNLSLTGTITLPLNCTTFLNGGSLTTNASGQIICADDETSGSGSSVTTAGGTAGTLPVFTCLYSLE
jgi:hypothetical protein